MAISPEIPPQSRITQEVGIPRIVPGRTSKISHFSDLQKERDILEPQVYTLLTIANSDGINSAWVDSLPPRMSTRIKINKQYTMEKTLEEIIRHPLAAPQIRRPSEEIRYALGGIRNNVTELYADLYTMGAIDGMTLVNTRRKNWKDIQSTIKHPEEEKITLAMNLTEKEAQLNCINFLLSTNQENIIYQISEADKKRTLRSHP